MLEVCIDGVRLEVLTGYFTCGHKENIYSCDDIYSCDVLTLRVTKWVNETPSRS